jgi:hypothetical protein
MLQIALAELGLSLVDPFDVFIGGGAGHKDLNGVI